jgi:2-polyprenyl-6-methoxyphenol hydroxylase-like FAD-dependent oxidoreductase
MLTQTTEPPRARPKPLKDNRALIIGAGLGGLTLALALLRTGWRVRVYAQAPALGEVAPASP